MNSLSLQAVAAELNSLAGNRVARLVNLGRWFVLVRWERGGGLAASVEPRHNALYAVGDLELEPEVSSPFVRGLEKALTGCRFTGARQQGLDRAIALSFERRDRLGDMVTTHLVLELTGLGGNLIHVDGPDVLRGTVRGSLRNTKSDRLRRGSPYSPLESTKIDATVSDRESLVDTLRSAAGPLVPRTLVDAWAGVSPRIAAEILARAGSTPDPEHLADIWLSLVEETKITPTLITLPRGDVEAFPFRSVDHPKADSFSTMSEAVAEAHQRFLRELDSQVVSPLARGVHKAMARVKRALDSLKEEETGSVDPTELRQTGEALLASAHQVPRGVTSAEIIDPRTGEPRSVRLNPKLSASGNAELYFKRARKAERRGERRSPRREELLEKRGQLEQLLRRLEALGADGPDAPWLREARSLGVPLPRSELERATDLPPEERLPSAIRPRRYDMGNGWELLVGRSNRGNDVLTHEIARPHEIWMHADQAAGSHAVLRHHEKGREPPASTLRNAAAIAAWFSKARNSAKASVIVSRKRHVRRARKAPVGTVMVGDHETLMVEPTDPDDRKEGK